VFRLSILSAIMADGLIALHFYLKALLLKIGYSVHSVILNAVAALWRHVDFFLRGMLSFSSSLLNPAQTRLSISFIPAYCIPTL
jgi:hypothetical protein